jgi:UDP-2-acetamido-2,6-beta-L-arabino-hexul-4-ose reductase
LTLAYIDDVVDEFMEALRAPTAGLRWGQVAPQYSLTVGELAGQIEAFRDCRTSLQVERVGAGLTRALYATFVSYLPTSRFSYPLPEKRDPRGTFVEMLKTRDSGQFSFFTAHAGVTRGGHYHHTKTEKFLVLKGKACFRFRNVLTQECHELVTDGDRPEVVETIPGWAHAITNIGSDEMIVMLWANEIFDRERPDTHESRF